MALMTLILLFISKPHSMTEDVSCINHTKLTNIYHYLLLENLLLVRKLLIYRYIETIKTAKKQTGNKNFKKTKMKTSA